MPARTHGAHGTTEYVIWTGMKSRCYCPTSTAYHLYGAKGVTVCKRWRDSFEAFLSDVGPRPSSDHSLDRIDSSGAYEPSNVRWATRKEQNARTSRVRQLTINGQTDSVAGWAERNGLERTAVYKRIRKGWDPVQAVTTPSLTGRPRML